MGLGGYPFPYNVPSTFFNHIPHAPGNYQLSPNIPGPAAVSRPVQAPAIEPWLHFIEQHPQRNPDHIPFTIYGPALLRQGILRVSQLTQEFIPRQDLQDWLGVDAGTAILLFQFAKEDAEAAKCGIDVIST
jgi:hypothetical protein